MNMIFPSHKIFLGVAFGLLVGSSLLLAQDQPAPPPPPPDGQRQSPPANGQWRKADDPPPAQSADAQAPAQASTPDAAPAPEPAPRATMDPNYSPQGAPPTPPNSYPNQYPNQYPSQPYPNAQGNPNAQGYPGPQGYPGGRGYPGAQGYPPQYPNQYPPAASYDRGPIPAKLTVKPGTYITVRLNQGLSSDRNQAGDPFAATLATPLVVDGVVVANRGQTVGGKVTEAKKAGRVQGVSHLAVQLTDITLADGQPVPVQTTFFSKQGPTSVGRDVAAVGATTATGAAIGAAAGWGTGAAIGAGAGAVVGIVGVLVTRGRPTYLYPEQILTFRVEAPVTVSTENATAAFRWAGPGDYGAAYAQNRPPAYRYGYPSPYAYPYAYSYPYAYAYPYWGGYWGPSFYFGGRWRR